MVLKSPETKYEWDSYHKIRERVLWESRGLIGVYRPDHPDEFIEGNHPRILIVGSEIVGVIRIDLNIKNREAIFRRVAISEEYQRRGYGRKLMELSEDFAIEHGCDTLTANVAKDAIEFYRKIGYEFEKNPDGQDPQNPRMKKYLKDAGTNTPVCSEGNNKIG